MNSAHYNFVKSLIKGKRTKKTRVVHPGQKNLNPPFEIDQQIKT